MTPHSVNRTSLHPHGVQCVPLSSSPPWAPELLGALARLLALPGNRYADVTTDRPTREHTEIEEELHERANIDYDRVAIVRARPLSVVLEKLSG